MSPEVNPQNAPEHIPVPTVQEMTFDELTTEQLEAFGIEKVEGVWVAKPLDDELFPVSWSNLTTKML